VVELQLARPSVLATTPATTPAGTGLTAAFITLSIARCAATISPPANFSALSSSSPTLTMMMMRRTTTSHVPLRPLVLKILGE